jgi:glyoxylase-like metal-dependent hydrolase (beta-lactamase superfamily II)/8-oxo-dGTP pyrophosphatase MutT (NUDIX family)
MLQRSSKADFMAGAYVFPGGGVDDGDRDPRLIERLRGLSAEEANARMGVARDGLAYWIAAVRECFEEAGILLACEEDGRPVGHERLATLEAQRGALNSGTLSFAAFIESARLVIDAGRLAFFDHWITPASLARRFDTRFFLAVAPERHEGAHDDTETVASVWTRPQDAIARFERKEIDLVFVTRAVLAELARFASPEEAFAHASALEEIEVNRPCHADGRAGKKLFRLGDPAYAEIRWSDPEETMQTSYDITPDLPKPLDRFVTRVTAANPGYATGPGTNTYLVGERELAVIDPGPALPAHIDAILAAGAGRIRWVLCTHTHIDHSPAAEAIRRATGAELFGRSAPTGTSQDPSFRPARELAHGERLALGGVHLRVLHTPGHASNHLCYLLEETRMLFTGDHVMQGSTVVISPPDGDMRAYLRSLELLLDEDVAILAPGHGYLIGNPRKEVRRLIRHRGMREAKVLATLRRLGEASLEEMLPRVYDDVQPALHAMAARSLGAHLDKLVAEQRAQLQNGRYRASGSSLANSSSGG